MSTTMLSLCCGALPIGGVIRTYQTCHGGTIYHLGHCAMCGGHAPFAPQGELETSPKWLRLPPLHALPKPELRAVGNGMGHYTSEGAAKLCAVCDKPLEDQGQTECYECWSTDIDRLWPLRPVEQKQRLMLATARLAVNDRWLVVLACAALAGWLAFIALGTWGALHRGGQGEGSQSGGKRLGEQSIGSSHALKGSSKAGGGQ